MSPPWTLEKVVWADKSPEQRLFEGNVEFFKELVVKRLGDDPPLRPEDWDRVLPNDPKIIESMLRSTELPLAAKEKVLELALLRGGSYPGRILGATGGHVLLGIEEEAAESKRAYQKMVVEAVVGSAGGPELLKALSASGDYVNHRQPATQLMHILLQEHGWMHHDKVEDWIIGIPDPEVRGQVMFHIYDAASRNDITKELKVGAEIHLGRGPLDVGLTLQYESKHWEQIVPDIRQKVKTDLASDEELAAYNGGLLKPDMSERPAAGG